ncbi:MAG: hypothetical protein H6659_01110 [Ardenticatenaceae bacterium]|nr:hypothetical protein [Ardenticatenaceae bacterium]MCB8986268.1 hypothetical protein [Ardenticatenaceae bacterium]
MRRTVVGFILTIVGVTLLAACNIGGGGVDECNAGGALFADDFSGEQNCGWALYNRGGAVTEIADDVLRISTSQPGQVRWTNPSRSFDDVIITTQARQVSGPNNNAYGVICRYQNEENFYIFLIGGDGYYAIGKYTSDSPTVTYLTENGEYQFSEAINQGLATNQIRTSCVGNELSLEVNGIPLVTVTDPTFVIGDVGLATSTLEPGTAVVEFDNFRVVAP